MGLKQSTLVDGDFNGDGVPTIEVVAEVLIHCNLVRSTNLSFSSKVIQTLKPDRELGSLMKKKNPIF